MVASIRPAILFFLIASLIDAGISAETRTRRDPGRPLGRFLVTEARWIQESSMIQVTGRGLPERVVTILDADSGKLLGTTFVARNREWRFEVLVFPVPCRIRVESLRQAIERDISDAPENCGEEPVTLTRLWLAGPTAVSENSSTAYTASAEFSDGSTEDVTRQADWSENSDFAEIEDGLLTVESVPSEQLVTLSARYSWQSESRTESLEVTVEDSTQGSPAGSHKDRVLSYEGTRTCLQCHRNEAIEVHGSVHYQWLGDSRDVINSSAPEMGKYGAINDFCVFPDINWIGKLTNVRGESVDGGCAKCHVGLGAKPTPEVTDAQLENIDCLVCHSEGYRRTVEQVDGQFQFVPDRAAMQMTVLAAAQEIVLPSNESCLRCHAFAGGGNNYKRGDLEWAHTDAELSLDVHMASRSKGGAGLGCLDCHSSRNHRIAGRGSDLRPRDLPEAVVCENCHTPTPHSSREVNRHTRKVDCTVCHIPRYAKTAPTDIERRWDLEGELDEVKGLYEPHMVKELDVKPEYRFFNGTSYFYNFGEEAFLERESGRVLMSGPNGSVDDPESKIHAFKYHRAHQPVDPASGRLLPLKIGLFFAGNDVNSAVEEGTRAVGWEYLGHEFARTERYMGLYHEVAPKEEALRCGDCHGGTRLDFGLLGYAPRELRNGEPLCTSCHEPREEDWEGDEYFYEIHEEHLEEEDYDCRVCHHFSRSP